MAQGDLTNSMYFRADDKYAVGKGIIVYSSMFLHLFGGTVRNCQQHLKYSYKGLSGRILMHKWLIVYFGHFYDIASSW